MFSGGDIPVPVAPSTGTCSALFPPKAFLSLEKGGRTQLKPHKPTVLLYLPALLHYEARSGIRDESVSL